jgi:hypothetical protein
MKMKLIAILLLVLGGIGLVMSAMMFGDIGVAAGIASIVSILSGIGFLQVSKALKSSA